MLFNNRATDALATRPPCDICTSANAAVDGKTVHGAWAYMCAGCHDAYGVGLGMGVGQVLLCGDGRDDQLKQQFDLR